MFVADQYEVSLFYSHEGGSYSDYFSDTYHYAYDWLSGSLDNCPFRNNMMESIKHNLERHIRGQNEGLDTILSAISAWEFQRQSGQSEPLVLALTGPTGVGKSETSFRLAEGALGKRSKVGKSLKYRPNGLLALRGEDYAEGSLAVIHESIRNRVIDHLEACSGNAVIVFDEVQKVKPGALEVLMPAFETRGSLSRTREVPIESTVEWATKMFFSSGTKPFARTHPVTTTHSTENVIFIFISDIGADMMTKLVLTYGNRSAIPQSLLRSEVKTALDEQWVRLQFGKVVREVVPYLPLEPEHIRDILRTKLRNLAADHRLSYWRDLVVDEDVIVYLSDPPLVKYSKYSTKKTSRASKSSTSGGEESGNSECTTDSTGNMQCSSTNMGNAGASSGGGGGSGSTGSGSTTATKLFATWGARSLENAGPLQDLKGKLSRYAQPWRPDQILHVGLATEANRERRNLKWGTQEKPSVSTLPGVAKTIYIQWCKVPRPSAGKKNPTEGLDEPSHTHHNDGTADENSEFIINDDIAFSDACETKWYGPLVG
eukprot:gene12998-14995_t